MSTLLVVDDDRLNCDLLQAVFTRHGYHVMTATSGRDALELFHKHSPQVTLLDLRMPDMDGLAVLKEIRAHDPAAGVIILGGGSIEDQENQARELRVTDFLRKGLSLDILIGAVNQVAQRTSRRETCVAKLGSDAPMLNESILVVDDEAMVRDLLFRFLSLRGYQVQSAINGPEAIAMIGETKPDLVVLDLLLPGMSAIDVLRTLRQKEYAGGVILLTGNHNEELLEEAWALGPQEVLGKPVDLERLLTSVQLVMVCREC
ncbi:MAG: response regulator [Nitrospiraceae bacterium]